MIPLHTDRRPSGVRGACLGLVGLLCLAACARAAEFVRPPAREAPLYGRVEMGFRVERPPENPWATDAAALSARFVAPSGGPVEVPAFWTRDYEAAVRGAEDLRSAVSALKLYVSDGDWTGVEALTVHVDAVRLVRADTGEERLIGDFESGLDGWRAQGSRAGVSRRLAARGGGSLRADFDLSDPPAWPGLWLDVAGEDWSGYDELRFSVHLAGVERRGPIRAEYYTAAGQKVQAGGGLLGVLRPDQWVECVWDLRPSMPGFVREPQAVGDPYWAVRFMPRELGVHRFEILERGQVALSGQFTCVPSDLAAPLRISPKDGFYFERTDGTPYLAVGENLCWYGNGRTADYEQWLGRLAESGGKYCRIWMPPWAFAIEWEELGRYRLDRAYELDEVLALARRLGVAVMLCLDYHGALRQQGGQWQENPYAAGRGGPCQRAADFFTHPEAARLYRQRLRYLVARYACYSNLLSWELFNEVNLAEGYDSQAVTDWHREMARYLRKNDPYDHIITTSHAGPQGDPATWELPEIEYTQCHDYASTDWAEHVATWTRRQRDRYGKPMLFGEFGLSHDGALTGRVDPEGIHLHNGLWGGVMAGGAGTAMTWWWDSYVHPNDLYRHFASLSEFLAGVEWTQGLAPAVEWRVEFAPGVPPEVERAVPLEGEGRSWEPAPFNQPQALRVDTHGTLEEPELLTGLLHGVVGHPDLHNPVTFVVEYPADGAFGVTVSGVSGHGGARLKVIVDGQEVLSREFRDDDPSTETIREYDGAYSVAVSAGSHRITVLNDGHDWLYASYVLRTRWRASAPNAAAMGLTGPLETLAWVRNRDFTWLHVARRGLSPSPVEGAVLVMPGLAVGEYEAVLWDSWAGRELERRRLSVDGALRLALPTFSEAVAVRLRRLRP